MITHTVNRGVRLNINGTEVLNQRVESVQSAGAESNIDEALTDATDQLIAFALDISQCKSLLIWATGGNITVKTNSSGTPDDTIALTKDQPIVWTADDSPEFPIPLSADITAIYATNTGSGTLHIRALSDPTV